MRAAREELRGLRSIPLGRRPPVPTRGGDEPEPPHLRQPQPSADPEGGIPPGQGRLIPPSRSDFWRISALVVVVVVLAALIATRRDAPTPPGPAFAVDDQATGDGPSSPDTTSPARSTREDVPQRQTTVGDEAASVEEPGGEGADGSAATSVASTGPSAPEEVAPAISSDTTPPADTTAPTTTTTAPPVTVAPPDRCETQTQGDETRGVEVKYLEQDAFAPSFRFYGSAQQLLYDTTTLDDNPTNRVRRDGYYEREWDIAANPSGYEPRDVHYVSAVTTEGESVLIRCDRTVVTDGG